MTVTYENSDVSESNDSPDNASINNDLKVDKISADEKKEVTEDKSKWKKFTDLFNVFSWKVFFHLIKNSILVISFLLLKYNTI